MQWSLRRGESPEDTAWAVSVVRQSLGFGAWDRLKAIFTRSHSRFTISCYSIEYAVPELPHRLRVQEAPVGWNKFIVSHIDSLELLRVSL